MKSKITQQFLKQFRALPAAAQHQTRQAYKLFMQNPRHGSLQFKCIDPREPPTYSARIGDHYRAVGTLEGDTVIWFWIGSHETYNKLFG